MKTNNIKSSSKLIYDKNEMQNIVISLIYVALKIKDSKSKALHINKIAFYY